MAHELQERFSSLIDEKLRASLVTRDNVIFNNRYEVDPKAGSVKIPVRDTEVSVRDYNKAKGLELEEGSTTYIKLDIDHDRAVNEIIDGFDADVYTLTEEYDEYGTEKEYALTGSCDIFITFYSQKKTEDARYKDVTSLRKKVCKFQAFCGRIEIQTTGGNFYGTEKKVKRRKEKHHSRFD